MLTSRLIDKAAVEVGHVSRLRNYLGRLCTAAEKRALPLNGE